MSFLDKMNNPKEAIPLNRRDERPQDHKEGIFNKAKKELVTKLSSEIEEKEQEIMFPQSQNPFAAVAQQPVTEDIVKAFVGNDTVPEKIRMKHWDVFSNDIPLGFATEKTKEMGLLEFDIQQVNIEAQTPYYDLGWAEMEDRERLRGALSRKFDRAIGSAGNIKNERILLGTQISEVKQISENSGSSNVQDGFFRRLLGRR